MKRYLIAIDTGTTNTRIVVWDKDRTIRVSRKFPVGVRMTVISENRGFFVRNLQASVERTLEEGNISWEEVEGITASGMITSGLGICEIPHVQAPAGINELAEAAVWIRKNEIFPKPILLIPGVCCGMERLEENKYQFSDMMRGEETETAAILEELCLNEKAVIFLPGSHDKVIFTNEDRRIICSSTSITGELLRALMQDTILAESVGKEYLSIEELDETWIVQGYRDVKEKGLGNTCFLARILQTKGMITHHHAANYILGAVLENDVRMLRCHPLWKEGNIRQILVSGNHSACHGLYLLLSREFPEQRIWKIKSPGEGTYAACGARLVWERAVKLKDSAVP